MPHTDAQILSRKIGLGPIGSAKVHKLTEAADNQTSDLPETTRVPMARSRAGDLAGQLAPAADSLSPPPSVAGALSDFPVHGHDQ